MQCSPLHSPTGSFFSSSPSLSVCLVSAIQIEQAKQDLSRKDSELLAFRTKLETLNNQFSDSKQHVDVLKESLTAKEQRAAILQTEVQLLKLIVLFFGAIKFKFKFVFLTPVRTGGCSSPASGGKGVSPL